MAKMKIAIVQCSKDDDVEKLCMMASDADLILLPELVSTKNLPPFMGVCMGYEKKHKKNTYNTYGYFFTNKSTKHELITEYRKQRMFNGYDDGRTAGNENVYTYIRGLKTYFAICYDIRHKEIFDKMECPELIIIPADFPSERIDAWQDLLRLRAIESNCYVIGINTSEGGHSAFIDSKGNVLNEFENQVGVLYAEIETN